MRLKHIVKSFLLVALFTVTSISAAFADVGALVAYFKVDGVWVHGTLYGNGISVVGGIATANPPWAFVPDKGTTIGDSKTPGVYEVYIPKSIAPNAKNSNYQIELSGINGVTVNSDELINIYLYDIETSSIIYTKEKVSNFTIPSDQVLKSKLLILLVIDEDGNTETYKFSVGDSTNLIDKP